MSKKNTLEIYWSVWCNPNAASDRVLLDLEPKSLMYDIIKNKPKNTKVPNSNRLQPGNYQSCTALHEFTKNIFILKSPISAKVKVNENGEILHDQETSQLFNERISSLENSFSVDFDMGIIFFSKESVNITITNPYMHKTSFLNEGYIVSGKYDISKWFRPIPIIYQLWEGNSEIHIEKNSPLAYLSFETEKKIKFTQFLITDKLINYAQSCMNHKVIMPFEPLLRLYQKFEQSGLSRMVIKEIENHII